MHERLYAAVESASVTPFSDAAVAPVYAVLSEVPRPARAVGVAARVAGVGRVLRRLAEHGLACRGPGGWVRGEGGLDRVAAALGVGEYLALLQARYRAERAAYHGLARRIAKRHQPAETLGPEDVFPLPPTPDPLADPDVDAAIVLVRHLLGGVLIEEIAG